jgi:hypothetical protein
MNYFEDEIDILLILQVGLSHPPICMSLAKIGEWEAVRRCRVDMTSSGAEKKCGRHFRARLLYDKDVKWTVYEIFVSTQTVAER